MGDTEHIYPYIYRNNRLGVYSIQEQSGHAPFYQMHMKTKQSMNAWSFPEIDLFTAPEKLVLFQKNLNAEYNSNTFIFRAFLNICKLLKNQFKISILE